jgi:hypothetical protein
VLSQPSLWTDFALNFVESPYTAWRRLPLVEAHIVHSQKLPLTITFFPSHEIECTEAEQALLDLLAAHCNRWEAVVLCGSTLLYNTLIGSIYGRLPILRKLVLRICSQLAWTLNRPISPTSSQTVLRWKRSPSTVDVMAGISP